MIELKVNGQAHKTNQKTIYDLIIEFGLNTRYLAVAHNGDIIDRNKLNEVKLMNGDSVEIVQPVGGG